MKKKFKLFFGVILFSLIACSVFANHACFIAKENGKVIKEQGDCDMRHSPFSTFKVSIALMGFDSKILIDADHPSVAYTSEVQKEYRPYFNPEKYPAMILHARKQTPLSWMKYSVIWYSQYITKKLGQERFQHYVNVFNYGNKDVSGDSRYHHGLINAWLGTSLEISPREQVNFVEKLRQQSLPIRKDAQRKTIQIMKLNSIFDDWQLYGKTGGPVEAGWFIGWVEKNGRVINFAQYIEQPSNSLLSGGRIAKEVAIDNLTALIIGKGNV